MSHNDFIKQEISDYKLERGPLNAVGWDEIPDDAWDDIPVDIWDSEESDPGITNEIIDNIINKIIILKPRQIIHLVDSCLNQSLFEFVELLLEHQMINIFQILIFINKLEQLEFVNKIISTYNYDPNSDDFIDELQKSIKYPNNINIIITMFIEEYQDKFSSKLFQANIYALHSEDYDTYVNFIIKKYPSNQNEIIFSIILMKIELDRNIGIVSRNYMMDNIAYMIDINDPFVLSLIIESDESYIFGIKYNDVQFNSVIINQMIECKSYNILLVMMNNNFDLTNYVDDIMNNLGRKKMYRYDNFFKLFFTKYDVNKFNDRIITLLCSNDQNMDILLHLLNNWIKTDSIHIIIEEYNEPILMFACRNNIIQILNIMIEYNANINFNNDILLIVAVLHNNLTIIEKLTDCGLKFKMDQNIYHDTVLNFLTKETIELLEK